jgi:hypothetical protein
MRFTESALVGIPIFWLVFLNMLIITGVDADFQEGQMTTGTMIEGFENLTEIDDITGLDLNDTLKTNPLDDPDESGVLSSIGLIGQGMGYIKTVIRLEISLLGLPITEVAGVQGNEEAMEATKIFNSLFWGLFVMPMHLILSIAILFFIAGR